MVVFNCNACGEALKKSQVEKHTARCRYCEVLSCVDCGKDFWGNDYQAHVKCITEDEKYCGKGYVPKINKGEAKQEQWIEKVQSAIERAISNPKLKGLLERLKDYPNIPRKKSKFENFLKNSLRINSDPLISQVWDTLMAAAGQDTAVQNNGHEQSDKSKKELASHKLLTDDMQNNVDTEGKEEKNKKSSKKEKNKKEDNIDNTERKNGEVKNRKRSEREETVQEETTVTEVQDNSDTQLNEMPSVGEHKLSKRDRKEERKKKANKKEKKDKNENNSNNVGKKGKKRKLSEIEEETQEEAEMIAVKSSEKRKKKNQMSESIEENYDSLGQNNGSDCKTPSDNETYVDDDEDTTVTKKKKSKKVKFNWEATILAVLKSKGEISLKKLQKKVMGEFAAQDAAIYSEGNLTAKFHKKLNKMAKVKVFKDRVKLK